MAISETQQRILEVLNEAYPDWADPSELRGIPELARTARYLEERGLIEVNWTEGEPTEPVLMKIRADGIDTLRDQPLPPPPLVPIAQFVSEGDDVAGRHAAELRKRRVAAMDSTTNPSFALLNTPTTEAAARSTPTIREAVTRNRGALQTTGAAFLVAIEDRLAYLRDARLNAPEAQAEFQACEQLKSRAEEFLEAAAVVHQPDESKLRALADAFADRLTHWVKEQKDFNDAMKLVMFLTGVGVCSVAGVPVLGTAFVGTIIGGTKVSEAVAKILKAWRH